VQVQVSEIDINTAKALKNALAYLKRQDSQVAYAQKVVTTKEWRSRHFGMALGDTRTVHFYDAEATMPEAVMQKLNEAFLAHAVSLQAELTRIVTEAIEAHNIKLV
jgi:hypothetical protein